VPTELRSWPRPHFSPGGGNPLLFFVTFGTFDLSKPLRRAKYRSDGPGDWLAVNHLTRDEYSAAMTGYQSSPARCGRA
jgi:hypothetical protein